MKKETEALAKALADLIAAVGNVPEPVEVQPPPAAPTAVVPPAVAPAPPAPVAPAAPAATPPPAPTSPMTHDEVRAHLLPIIQSDQNAMTAVHGVLTGQFGVNELTSLPVAQIPQFMEAVNQALEAAKA